MPCNCGNASSSGQIFFSFYAGAGAWDSWPPARRLRSGPDVLHGTVCVMADDRDKRPFFRRSERRSLTESIRDGAWEQRAAPQSSFEEPHPGMAPNDAEMPD